MGLAPTQDDDGDWEVRINDQKLFVRISDDGPGLVRVFGQWRVMADLVAPIERKREAAHEVTAAHALVKVNFFAVPDDAAHPGHLIVVLDQIAPVGTRYDLVLPPALDAVLSGARAWHHLLTEHSESEHSESEHSASEPSESEHSHDV